MKRLIALALICLLSLSMPPLMAQAPTDSPLIFVADRHIYKWENGETVQLTTGDGYSDSPDYAPDGTQFVYRTWSQITLDFVNRQVEEFGVWGGDGEMPTDIVIYNLATNETTLVATSDADADPLTLLGATRRSAPKWSPDGTMLAWTEVIPSLDEGENFVEIYQLVVYDIPTATSKVLTTDLPPAIFYSIPHAIEWGGNGIYINFFSYQDSISVVTYRLYSVTGELVFDVLISHDIDNAPPLTSFVALHSGQEVYALYYPDGSFRVIDQTGAIEDIIAAAPQKYNTQTPNGLANVMMVSNGNAIIFYVTNPTDQFQTLLTDTAFNINQVRVSPDGASAAFLEPMTGVINIWNNMTVTSIPSPTDADGNALYIPNFIWGIEGIRILQS